MNRKQRVVMNAGNALAVGLMVLGHSWADKVVLVGDSVEIHTNYFKLLALPLLALLLTQAAVLVLKDRNPPP